MAITLQLTLIVSIIVSSSIVLGASIPLLNSGASVNSGVSGTVSNSDNQPHAVSSKTFIGPYESLFLSRFIAPDGASDAIAAADTLSSILADQVTASSKYPSVYPLDDDSLFLQQLSSSARSRGKRSGISDQKLAEIETLLALRAFKLLQDQSRIAYGVIDPEKI